MRISAVFDVFAVLTVESNLLLFSLYWIYCRCCCVVAVVIGKASTMTWECAGPVLSPLRTQDVSDSSKSKCKITPWSTGKHLPKSLHRKITQELSNWQTVQLTVGALRVRLLFSFSNSRSWRPQEVAPFIGDRQQEVFFSLFFTAAFPLATTPTFLFKGGGELVF